MAHTDPSPTTQIIHGEASGDQLSQVAVLDPPTLSFISTPSNLAHVRPSTGRTSITQVEHGDDEQLLASEPTSQDVASSTSNVAPQASELISTVSQDQQQSVQQPSTPAIQPQPVSQTVPQMPQTYLTFLLISGRRRTMSFEPESPIGRVKELVWNSWPTGQCPLRLSIASLTMIISGLSYQNGKMSVRLLLPICEFCTLAKCCRTMKLYLVSTFATSSILAVFFLFTLLSSYFPVHPHLSGLLFLASSDFITA